MPREHIKIENITKTFKEDHRKRLLVLDHVSLSILEGEFFVIVGPSGSGKSTLLRIITGLAGADHGKVTFPSDLVKTDIGFVFQQFALLPWLSVYKNIELALKPKKLSPEIVHARVVRELVRFGLEHFAHAYPKELSGGMRQRVGLARAFAIDPKIIFMDEPFSELDSFTSGILRKELLWIWAERRPTIILVTHIIEEAIELADRIAVLSARPATIEHIFDNTIARPRAKRSAEFFALEDKIAEKIKP